MRKGAFTHDPAAQFRAREFRAEMSVGEMVLWNLLRRQSTGHRFRRQVRVDRFFLDFYCAKAKLCIEVDGEQHAARVSADAYRDRLVRSLGIETLRIPSLDLMDAAKCSSWLRTIERLCEERAISTPLPPSSKTSHFEEGE